MEVHATSDTSPINPNWVLADVKYRGADEAIVQENTNSPYNGSIQPFGGFISYYYYLPEVEDKLALYVEAKSQVEVRYGFCYFADTGSQSYLIGTGTSSQIGSFYYDTNIDVPSSKSYRFFVVSVYSSANVEEIKVYNRYTMDEIVGSQIIQNQDKNAENIINNQDENTDRIIESQENIENALTSTDYDENVIQIDTSSFSDVDDSSSTQLFTTVFENFSNLLDSTNWSQVEIIEIGLPFTDGKLELRSDILSKIVGNSFLSTLISVSWYSLFGLYCFRFVTHIYHSIKSGDILGGLNLNNEVISSTML